MPLRQVGVEEILRKDPRYPPEAYQFVFDALAFTQRQHAQATAPATPLAEKAESTEREAGAGHVSGPRLLYGIRALALQEFGFMARTVFRLWNIHETADFGEIVYNLIEAELMSRTEKDSRKDFHNVFNLDEALLKDFCIAWDEKD